MKPLRIVLMGGKDLAVNCLSFLLEIGEEISAVVVNPTDLEENGKWYQSLRRFSRLRGLPLHQPGNANSNTFLEVLREIQPDLLFSMSYEKILKRDILGMPRLGAVNIHFSRLPRYRGCLPIVYALSEEEPVVGVSIHYMDEGIDTGDIIAQETLPVAGRDTAFTLYFKCVELGTKLFRETYPLIATGQNARMVQESGAASYHPQVYPHGRWIDWNWPEKKIHSFIRAHTFPPYPGARFIQHGFEMEVRMIDGRCVLGDRTLSFEEFLGAYRQSCPRG
jgi:methionyl-tRNA formyltransferase